MPSPSLNAFKENLARARELARIERRLYKDPPRPSEVAAVEGIRAGASVLMVAALESFLRDRFAEFIDGLVNSKQHLAYAKLPSKLRVANTYNTLDRAMRGPLRGSSPGKASRLQAVKQAASLVHSDHLNPEAFGDSSGGPGKDKIQMLFKDAGLVNAFDILRPRFQTRWKLPIAHTYIQDSLEQIVDRRHKAAHGAAALTISRADITISIRFLAALAEAIDIELRAHQKRVARSARTA